MRLTYPTPAHGIEAESLALAAELADMREQRDYHKRMFMAASDANWDLMKRIAELENDVFEAKERMGAEGIRAQIAEAECRRLRLAIDDLAEIARGALRLSETARDEGAAEERASVVAHLRSMAKPYEDDVNDYERGVWWAWMSEVEVIERGDHAPATEDRRGD